MKLPTATDLLRLPQGTRRRHLAAHTRIHRAALAATAGDDPRAQRRRLQHGRALRHLAAVSRAAGPYLENALMDVPDRVIAEIPRGSREAIRISLSQRRGQMACEARVVAAAPRGPMRDTSRGFRIPLSRLRAAIEGMEAAEREAQRRGLLPNPTATAGRIEG